MSSPYATTSTRKDTMIAGQNVDLSNCDRELVQYSSAIQPYGVLLTVNEADHTILQASVNVGTLVDRTVEATIGAALEELFGKGHATALLERCRADLVQSVPVHVSHLSIGGRGDFDAFGHRIDCVLVLEFERRSASAPPIPQLYSEVRACATRLQAAGSALAGTELARLDTIVRRQIRGHQ